eukprot:gene31033-38355_t
MEELGGYPVESGEGKCEYANGDVYTGSWKDDQRSGF